MKFDSKLVRKAWQLFKIKANGLSFKEAKAFLSDAYKRAIKYFQALKAGKVTFWKISTGEICTRNVVSLQEVGYTKKTDKPANENMFYFIDLDKWINGENAIFSINNFQIL